MTLAQNHQPLLNGSRMKKRFVVFVIFFCCLAFVQAQETTDVQTEQQTEVSSFVIHKVRKKETLYTISKRYDITIEQIKAYNPILNDKVLQKRMKLRIPRFRTVHVVIAPPPISEFEYYKVKPKDNLWRIAYSYGISLDSLKTLNPSIGPVLSVGDSLKIPKSSFKNPKTIAEDYYYYTVKPKEGFFRLKQKLGVLQSTLEELNPGLKENGLKSGQILKVPKKLLSTLVVKDALLIEKTQLSDSILKNKDIRMVLMAPFLLNSLPLDSIEATRKVLNQRNLHTLSLDFYTGVHVALNQLKDYDLNLRLEVLDTENKLERIQDLSKRHEVQEADLIMGPFVPKLFSAMTENFKNTSKILISPLSNLEVSPASNVLQSVPTKEVLQHASIQYFKSKLLTDSLTVPVIIADRANVAVKQKLLKLYPQAQTIDLEENFIKPDALAEVMKRDHQNWVFLETQNPTLIHSIPGMLNAMISDTLSIRMFTTFHTSEYENENVSREHLGALAFTYATDRVESPHPDYLSFESRYKSLFGIAPNAYAVRGFDLTMDAVLRWALRSDPEQMARLGQTEYLQHKFYYRPHPVAGFQNTSVYLVRHHGLDIEVLSQNPTTENPDDF